MRKFWFGLAFAAMLISPASAQDYHRNWVECAKELGWQLDHTQKLSRLCRSGQRMKAVIASLQ